LHYEPGGKMQIDVSQLLKEPVGAERDYSINSSINIMENGSFNAIQGNVRLTRTSRSILAKGRVSTTIYMDCARCLNKFGCPVVLDFEEEYFPAHTISGFDLPPDEDDMFTIDKNRIIDLTEIIRQYALIKIPIKPLCSDDCEGL
jgi:uncharacterized protein